MHRKIPLFHHRARSGNPVNRDFETTERKRQSAEGDASAKRSCVAGDCAQRVNRSTQTPDKPLRGALLGAE